MQRSPSWLRWERMVVTSSRLWKTRGRGWRRRYDQNHEHSHGPGEFRISEPAHKRTEERFVEGRPRDGGAGENPAGRRAIQEGRSVAGKNGGTGWSSGGADDD